MSIKSVLNNALCLLMLKVACTLSVTRTPQLHYYKEILQLHHWLIGFAEVISKCNLHNAEFSEPEQLFHRISATAIQLI
jgi:hypothetical protein